MGQYVKVEMGKLRKGVQGGKKEIFEGVQGESSFGSY